MARADKNTLTRKKVGIYTDFMMNFDKNPHTGFLGVVQNEDSVKQSLRQLFLTNKGERFFDSEKGGDIRDLLFENMDIGLSETFKIQLTGLIQEYEPRAQVNYIDISFDQGAFETTSNDIVGSSGDRYRTTGGKAIPLDNNTISVKVVFSVHNIQQEQELDISIRRVR